MEPMIPKKDKMKIPSDASVWTRTQKINEVWEAWHRKVSLRLSGKVDSPDFLTPFSSGDVKTWATPAHNSCMKCHVICHKNWQKARNSCHGRCPPSSSSQSINYGAF
eukprot:scaffold172499_cov48-Attheya_sp.AAC.2